MNTGKMANIHVADSLQKSTSEFSLILTPSPRWVRPGQVLAGGKYHDLAFAGDDPHL